MEDPEAQSYPAQASSGTGHATHSRDMGSRRSGTFTARPRGRSSGPTRPDPRRHRSRVRRVDRSPRYLVSPTPGPKSVGQYRSSTENPQDPEAGGLAV